MNTPKNLSGHFASIYAAGVNTPTTITSQRKSMVRAAELAKRALLAAEIEVLTGSRPAMIARSIDGVSRRWTGVKNHGSD